MARPPLPIGTCGNIRTEKLAGNRFRARARYRDDDGKTRDVEATRATGPAAIRALKVKLRDRTTPNGDGICQETRINTLGELWIAAITVEERCAPQTIHRYQTGLRTAILPALGNLRIREATVGRLDAFLQGVAKDHPSAARAAKVVLGQMFALAVRHDAIPANPVRDTSRLHQPRRKPAALTTGHLQAVRTAIHNWQQPTQGKSGPRHTSDLADVVDLMLATGARIGEVLALRWDDLDLATDRPTLTISGTLVYVKGTGFFRQERAKSDAGYRTLVLPRFAVGMLLARKLVAADNPHDAIFTSRRGTWLSPNNVRRQWRQARTGTELEWVTPHTFRKTVATLVGMAADTASAAAQLGHASEATTNTYYIAKPVLAPDVSEVLEQLGSQPLLHNTQSRHHGR